MKKILYIKELPLGKNKEEQMNEIKNIGDYQIIIEEGENYETLFETIRNNLDFESLTVSNVKDVFDTFSKVKATFSVLDQLDKTFFEIKNKENTEITLDVMLDFDYMKEFGKDNPSFERKVVESIIQEFPSLKASIEKGALKDTNFSVENISGELQDKLDSARHSFVLKTRNPIFLEKQGKRNDFEFEMDAVLEEHQKKKNNEDYTTLEELIHPHYTEKEFFEKFLSCTAEGRHLKSYKGFRIVNNNASINKEKQEKIKKYLEETKEWMKLDRVFIPFEIFVKEHVGYEEGYYLRYHTFFRMDGENIDLEITIKGLELDLPKR